MNIEKKMAFGEICDRLKLVLDLSSDVQLAEKLGLKQTAWAQRKSRNSLPTEAIDALIESECLNPEFIYEGNGPVHRDLNELDWEAIFWQRMSKSLTQTSRDTMERDTAGRAEKERYTQAKLKGIAEGKYAPTPKERQGARYLARLLRDMRRSLKIDLNWLLCGDVDTALNQEERALVTAYRKAPTVGKEFIRHAAGMAGNITASSPAPPAPEIDLVADYKPNRETEKSATKVSKLKKKRGEE